MESKAELKNRPVAKQVETERVGKELRVGPVKLRPVEELEIKQVKTGSGID